jgi:ribonuclease HII
VIKKSGVNTKNIRSIFSDYGIKPVFINDIFPVFSFVKGDENVPVIGLASIVAKVTRDGYMTRLAKKYPAYDFETHKGYGTKRHILAIRKFGPSKVHRLTFINNFRKMG